MGKFYRFFHTSIYIPFDRTLMLHENCCIRKKIHTINAVHNNMNYIIVYGSMNGQSLSTGGGGNTEVEIYNVIYFTVSVFTYPEMKFVGFEDDNGIYNNKAKTIRIDTRRHFL